MKVREICQKKRLWQDGGFFLLLIVAACFLFWKCRYGITSVDEGLYLSIPYRLVKGDGLFSHEWHLSQMSGVLTLPWVWLYMTVKGSTEGLVLFMRCLCTAVQCLITVFLYLRLKRCSYLGAVVASLCFVLYIPFGIMALSYNSMGIMALCLSGILLLPGKKERRSDYVLAGLCFAAAVLCCPYLAAVFAVYWIAVGAGALYRRRAKKPQTLSPWSIKGAALMSAGCAAAALAFGIVVFSRTGLKDMMESLVHIMDDPEHPSIGLLTQIKTYVKGIVFATPWSKWLYAMLGLLLAACAADRKRMSRSVPYFCAAAGLTLMLTVSHFHHLRYINYVMWSLNVMGPFLLLLSKEQRLRQLFCCLWIPGILYSFCIHLCSNQVFITISSASTVATVGTLTMMGVFLEEQERGKRYSSCTYIAGLLAAVHLATLGYLRYYSVFWDQQSGMAGQTQTITQGVQSGLLTSESRYHYYLASVERMEKVGEYAPEKVLYLTNSTWYCLEGNYEMSGYSAWLSGPGEHTLKRLQAYYEQNPYKLPDLICADAEYAKTGSALADIYGYEATEIPGIWTAKK